MVKKQNRVEEEYKRARVKGRQPVCPYCHSPLRIGQTVQKDVSWHWNSDQNCFEPVVMDGDAEKPFCLACQTRDWGFIATAVDLIKGEV